MNEKSTSRSRAFSPVISAIIISAVVMAVGGAVWAFSQGAMTITAEDYAEEMIEITEVISERFIIEMVWHDDSPIPVEVMEEVVGTGDASTTIFYLGHSPVDAESETIYLDGTLLESDYTLDIETGEITFVVAPADGVAITANYDYFTNQLNVWIFNYGPVDIEVKVQVRDITCPEAGDEWIEVSSKDMVPFPTINLSANFGEELNIIAYTKRGNNAYYKYIVPQG